MDKFEHFEFHWTVPQEKIPWSLCARLIDAGHSWTTSHSYFLNNIHRGATKKTVIQYSLQGCGMLIRNDENLLVPEGSAMFVTIPDNQQYCLPPNSNRWEFLFFELTGPEVARLSEIIIKQVGNIIKIKPNGLVVKTMNEITWHRETGFRSAFENAEYTLRLLYSIMEESLEGNSAEDSKPEFISKISRLALNKSRLTYSDMLECTPYSKEYFNRIFKQYMKQTPQQYLRQYQLEKARNMLKYSPLPLKTIASECGFSDSAHLCRIVKKYLHATPGEIRRAHDSQ